MGTLGQRLAPPRNPPNLPEQGQRCAGRNFNGRRCCTPEDPCDYGEGDCDGPADGGANDGHAGCREILCVEATTVRSLVTTIMRRMTAEIFQRLCRTHLLNHKLLLMLL